MSSLIDLDKDHKKRLLKKLRQKDDASHLIFRLLGPVFQKEFAQNVVINKIPKVFIHGNPHIDNYARTFTGAGLIDFDRSRIGPYAWDIIRFLASLILRGEGVEGVPNKPLKSFLEGYQATFEEPDIYFPIPTFVTNIIPTEDQLTTQNYLDAGQKWAKKMRKGPIDIEDQGLNSMLSLYLESRKEKKLLKYYQIAEAGASDGSLGKKHYLIVLRPKQKDSPKDAILIDLKETYQEKDTEHFYNPTDHHGLRMIKASNLYAPGVEQRLGHFTFEKSHYWGREIPSFSAKLKDLLKAEEQEELAFCIGAQLGRGHRRSCREQKPETITKDLKENIDQYKEICEMIVQEVLLGLEYLEKTENLKSQLKKKLNDPAPLPSLGPD